MYWKRRVLCFPNVKSLKSDLTLVKHLCFLKWKTGTGRELMGILACCGCHCMAASPKHSLQGRARAEHARAEGGESLSPHR